MNYVSIDQARDGALITSERVEADVTLMSAHNAGVPARHRGVEARRSRRKSSATTAIASRASPVSRHAYAVYFSENSDPVVVRQVAVMTGKPEITTGQPAISR